MTTIGLEVSELCKKHNILLAFDEVQTGFGRTGENFAHQLYDVKPDIMGCGKAAGGEFYQYLLSLVEMM